MHNRKHRISLLAALFAVIAISAYSQYNTYSPYTRFGLGNLAKDGFGQNTAMGGTGIALKDENQLNYLNPAAYAARDSMSVLFDFGMDVTGNYYSTSELSKKWWNGNFHHIALSLPIGKHFAIASGVVPFSAVGYNIKQEYNDLGTGDAIDYYFNGQGGIMRYFLGGSVELFDRLALGLNMNYLLGDISRQRYMNFPRNRGFAETRATEDLQMKQSYFGFGFQYKEVFQDKFFFTIGATYDLETDLKTNFNLQVTNSFSSANSVGALNDSTYIYSSVDILSDESEKVIILPSKLGLGIAFGIPQKLTVTGDYYIQDWAAVNNSSLKIDGFDLATAKSRRAGIEYIPNFKAFRGYHNLISYRVGGYMNDSYVKVGDYQLQDYGITFGVGLPLGKTNSSLNIGFDLGTRGTRENNLVKENYGIITFNVTLHDLWFYKRKYD